MACILRVTGERFSPEECLAQVQLKAYLVWRKGEPRSRLRAGSRRPEHSGFAVTVSDADGDCVPVQIKEAQAFCEAHSADLHRIATFPGVEEAMLDFAWWFPVGEDRPAGQFNYFTPQLVALCGQLGLGIMVTVYASEHEDDNSRTSQPTWPSSAPRPKD